MIKLHCFYAARDHAGRREGNAMNQNENHPQGMQGYGQPNMYFQNPQFQQNGMNPMGYPPAQAGQPQNGAGYFAPGANGYSAPGASGYTAPGASGYTAPGANGYSAPRFQQQAGYTTPQVPFAQGTNKGYSQEMQPPVQPYAAPSAGQGLPYTNPSAYSVPQQGGNGGSYIPQTPYSPGYVSPGYQPPQAGYVQQGYPQPGYNPYGQMGRVQQPAQEMPEYDPSIPLNGGGYVPQKIPVRKRPFVMKDWYLVLMGAVLVALFVAGVILLGNTPLKILLIVLAAGTAGALWIRPVVAENKRLTYSILALALCILTAVSFLLRQPNDVTGGGKGSGQQTEKVSQDPMPEIPADGVYAAQAAPTEAPTPEVRDNSLMERLVAFFTYWSENRQDEMLSLCAPSWQGKQENPRTSLFSLLANRRPTDCTPESITGTDADNSRRVTLTATIDRNNLKKSEKFRMTILMVKENNEWYVDPQSLLSYEQVETPDPNITPTVAPTDTPAIYPSTELYYNPNGGEYYHYDAYCKQISPKFTPLQGRFTYAEVNNEPYSKLKPCNVCGAPLRDQ